MAEGTKNFRIEEFACKCGCGKKDIDQRVVNMAQRIRDELGVPVRVNSGCRCESHNQRVGGVKGSKHVLGKACDLSCELGAGRIYEAVKRMYEEGRMPELDYCIRYKTFVHIDCGGKRRKLWEERV